MASLPIPCRSDLLQIGQGDAERPAVFRVELRSDAKEGMNESALPDQVALRQPPDLPFPDQMHRFVPSIVLNAPSADRNHRLAAMRFLINRWSCSMTLFK